MNKGFVLWFTGLSGAGKSTVAHLVAARLREASPAVELLDGDAVRTNLSRGLGFSRQDRDTNVLRIGWVACLLARHGVAVLTAAISPYAATRDQVRAMVDDFVEVYVDAPLAECAARDVKGLYKKAAAGEIPLFTGVTDPYEPPAAPEVHLRTDTEEPQESAERVLAYLQQRGWIPVPG
jgi:adenylylsulfate kinase